MEISKSAPRYFVLAAMALFMLLPSLRQHDALAADAPREGSPEYLELDEVLVQGRRLLNNTAQMTSWLGRLVGDFHHEGYIEWTRDGDAAIRRTRLAGKSHCSNIGAPGLVQCLMNVELEGTGDVEVAPMQTSLLAPAVAVYGIYMETPVRPGAPLPEARYIGHMQVDGTGRAETGMGQLFDDTLVYRSACSPTPGCQRTVHIEALPGAPTITMSVDIQRDRQPGVRYFLQWNRTSLAQEPVDAGPRAGQPVGTAVPAADAAWLRALVGGFRVEMAPQDCFTRSPIEKPCSFDGTSKAECAGIGEGGVRCVRDMAWSERRVPPSRTKAALTLWGYDPVAGKIVLGWALPPAMDGIGAMVFAAGVLKDNEAKFPECTVDRRLHCFNTWVSIPKDGSYVRFRSPANQGGWELMKMVRLGTDSAVIAPEGRQGRGTSPRHP